MPKQYEALKRHFLQKGLNERAAKTKAAKIYNARRPQGAKPVTRGYD